VISGDSILLIGEAVAVRRKKVVWSIGLGLLALLGVCAGFYGKPAYLLLRAWWSDRPVADNLPPGYVDDMSRLNATHVAEVVDVAEDPAEAEKQLREVIARARRDQRKISIAGARHSMGGQTIYPEGIYVNMLPYRRMELDADRGILHVGAGARWEHVIAYLDPKGFSVAIMQATHNFTVGGSLSVNCHGWQHNRPPIASSVESFRLMNASGAIVRCSREENTELFRLALGGYGLFGIILDVDLRVVPNAAYAVNPPLEVSSSEYVQRFHQAVREQSDVTMAIGRLDVDPTPAVFLRKSAITLFRPSPKPIPALKSPGYAALRRSAILAEVGSAEGKKVRWDLELKAGKYLAGKVFSRNQLLNEDATLYQEGKAERTEILHEYFLPPEGFEPFLERLRGIVPRHHGDLLHVTVRDVNQDRDIHLNYATKDMFAFVMLFSQERNEEADRRMEAMTREMIDAALDSGGTYYLPYRLHGTPEQFHRSYPSARTFFERKRHYDPEELFQNQFYVKYGKS
jgi:FAD/FMN-containing dehydrogenase